MIGLLILLGIALALLMALLTAMISWQMVNPPRRTAAWALARGLPSDPHDLNLQFEEWRLDRPGGLSLPVWDIRGQRTGAGDAVGGNLTAVLVHGWGHSRINWLGRIGLFLPLADRLVLYDRRGHGDAPAGANTLGDGEDSDLLALLERLDGERLLLVGHSMGAVIALRTAMRSEVARSRTIVGVIAYGAYCDFNSSLRGRMHLNGLPARPLTDMGLLIHRIRGVTPASIDPARMADFRIPLLLIHGIDDAISPVAHARLIAQAVPDATLVEVADAAHTDSHRVDEHTHDEAVRGFIEGLGKSPGR